MTRQYARISVEIWKPGSDFIDLHPHQKLAYLFLLSQPKITLVGCIDVQLERWASRLRLSVGDLQTALDGLEDQRFIVVDDETGELVVRSFVKHNSSLSPKTLAGVWGAWRAIESVRLREIVAANMPASAFENERVPPACPRPTLVDNTPKSVDNTPKSVDNPGDKYTFDGVSDGVSDGASILQNQNQNQNHEPEPEPPHAHATLDQAVNQLLDARGRFAAAEGARNPQAWLAKVRAATRAELVDHAKTNPGRPWEQLATELASTTTAEPQPASVPAATSTVIAALTPDRSCPDCHGTHHTIDDNSNAHECHCTRQPTTPAEPPRRPVEPRNPPTAHDPPEPPPTARRTQNTRSRKPEANPPKQTTPTPKQATPAPA